MESPPLPATHTVRSLAVLPSPPPKTSPFLRRGEQIKENSAPSSPSSGAFEPHSSTQSTTTSKEGQQQSRRESSQPQSSSPSRNNDKNSSLTKRKRTASDLSEEDGDNEEAKAEPSVRNKILEERLKAINTLVTGPAEQLRLSEQRAEDIVKRQLQRTEKMLVEKLDWLVLQASQQRNKEENEEVLKLRQEKKDLEYRLRNERAAHEKLYEKNRQTNKQLREANRLAKKTGRRSEDLEKQANEAMERIKKLETENKQLKQQKEELESRLEEETDKVEYLESKLQRMTMTEENDIPVEDDSQERERYERELENHLLIG